MPQTEVFFVFVFILVTRRHRSGDLRQLGFDLEKFTLDFLPKLKGLNKFTLSFEKKEIVNLKGTDIPFIAFDDLLEDKATQRIFNFEKREHIPIVIIDTNFYFKACSLTQINGRDLIISN